ncbi:MAG TPA: DUF2799 domain-containing protein [Verrucomicrobiae bacterium]|nr:DUF2799 domain-containing protein [Verrucomicrobiae bacterium]
MRLTLIALAASALLASCASMSDRECRSGNWREVGRADGAKGLPAGGELPKHRKACSDHGVTPDLAAYRTGHAEGLASYCTPSSGYVAARRGELYREVCPAGSVQFLEAFRRGRQVSLLLQETRDLRRRIDEAQLSAMSDESSPEDRTNLRFRSEELELRLRQSERDLERLDRRYAKAFGAPELSYAELRD